MVYVDITGVTDLYLPKDENLDYTPEGGYDEGYADGYGDGYTSGYTSGYTDGAASLNLTSVTRNIRNNGTINIAPPAGYNGLSSVTINTDIDFFNPLEPPETNWDYMWVKDIIGYPAVTFSATTELQIHKLNYGENFDHYSDWTTISSGTTITVPLRGAVCFIIDNENETYITFSGKCSVGGKLDLGNLNIEGDVVDASCVSIDSSSLHFNNCPELVLGPYAGLGYDIFVYFNNTPKLSYLFLYDGYPSPSGEYHLSFSGTQNPFGICYHQAYVDHRWYYDITRYPRVLPSGWREIKTL